MNYTLSISSTRNIYTLQKEWERLDEIAVSAIKNGKLHYMNYTFYQTYEWNRFLYDSYNHLIITTEYVSASFDGEIKLILPLKVDSYNKRLYILTGDIAGICNAVCPYVDETAKELISATIIFLKKKYKNGWEYRMHDIPLRSSLVEILVQNGAYRIDRGSYHIPVDSFESYDSYLYSLGKNIYKNIRKAYNHLSSDGISISLHCFTSVNPPSRNLLLTIWKLYFFRKLAWIKRSDTFMRRIVCRIKAFQQVFLGRQTKSMFQLLESELYVLKINNKVSAFMHTYVHQNHVLMPKLAIDKTFSRYSPGILLIQEAMKQFIERGITDFDLCRGDERYKTEVGGVCEPIVRLTLTC